MPAGPFLVDDDIRSLCSRAHADAGNTLICEGFANATPEAGNALPSVPKDQPPIVTHRTSMLPDVLTPKTSTVQLDNHQVVPRDERWLAVANFWSAFIDVHVTLATTGRIRLSAIPPPEWPVDV